MQTQTGTVKWFSFARGFGFITPANGGDDVFVHISAVERSGLETLREGDRVTYELTQSRDGRPKAIGLDVGPTG
jgi:CspA family cold shock protein